MPASRDSLLVLARGAKVDNPQQAADALLLLIEGATTMAMLGKDPKAALRAKAVALSILRGRR